MAALRWMADRPDAQQRIREREQIISRVEQEGAEKLLPGEHMAWLRNSDSYTKHMCADVNGPLAQMLCERVRYHDADAVARLQTGDVVAGSVRDAEQGPQPGACSMPNSDSVLQVMRMRTLKQDAGVL